MEARGAQGRRAWCSRIPTRPILIDCLESVRRGRSWIDPELSERIAMLAARGGSDRPTLAPRERDLIHCVRKGLRNREIAEQLGVTEGTVKVYLHARVREAGGQAAGPSSRSAPTNSSPKATPGNSSGPQPAMRLAARPTTIWLARS